VASLPRQDQRIIAALGYLFTPVVPAVVMLGELKRDAALRLHAAQALLWSVAFGASLVAFVVAAIWMIRTDALFICQLPFLITLPFVPGAIWARRVYLGGGVRIRGLTGPATRLADRIAPEPMETPDVPDD
jgi:hypothetical protein